MKLFKLTLTATVATTFLIVGCTATKTVSEESLGLRTADLYSENKVMPNETKYGTSQPMSGYKIERAYENAPPMIPHDVEGMLPITINSNQCTTCHEPAVAVSMNATPIPKSHFTDFRPSTALSQDGIITKEGKTVENTSDFKTVGKSLPTLAGARFNCTQCHAPQSVGNDVPKNVFEADFRNKESNSKSNLVDTINEGVK